MGTVFRLSVGYNGGSGNQMSDEGYYQELKTAMQVILEFPASIRKLAVELGAPEYDDVNDCSLDDLIEARCRADFTSGIRFNDSTRDIALVTSGDIRVKQFVSRAICLLVVTWMFQADINITLEIG